VILARGFVRFRDPSRVGGSRPTGRIENRGGRDGSQSGSSPIVFIWIENESR